MRCYHINNFYLNGIHAGIQSAHAQHELAVKYLGDTVQKNPYFTPARESYLEWATKHKTIIVLNGGMQCDLERWVELLSRNPVNAYAWAPFHEAQEALNGALTNVALVLPEHIYKHARQISTIVAGWTGAGDRVTILKNPDIHIYLERADTAREVWKLTTEMYVDDDQVTHEQLYTKFDVELMSMLSKCNLM